MQDNELDLFLQEMTDVKPLSQDEVRQQTEFSPTQPSKRDAKPPNKKWSTIQTI